MKRILALLVVALLLVGCGETGKENTDKVKVALLVQSLGDSSFNDSAHEGAMRASEDFKDKVELDVIEYGDDPSKYDSYLLETADDGYELILIGGKAIQGNLETNAKNYPDTIFVLFDSKVDYATGNFDNIYSITYKSNEAAYLGGYLAAKESESGLIGFLGGKELPVINDFLVGYIQGAKQANPNIKVNVSFTGDFYDPAKGKELAIAMIDQGSSLIFTAAGSSGLGAIEAASEKGATILGVDADQAMAFEKDGKQKLADTVITSVLKNIGDSLYRAVDLFLKDELKAGLTENIGIAEGGVGLADNKYYQKAVSEEVRKEVDALAEKIKNKEITVDSAYGMTTEQINEVKNSVRP